MNPCLSSYQVNVEGSSLLHCSANNSGFCIYRNNTSGKMIDDNTDSRIIIIILSVNKNTHLKTPYVSVENPSVQWPG